MSDDVLIAGARPPGPSTRALLTLVVVGLAAVLGLYALAPEGEHAPEEVATTATTTTDTTEPRVVPDLGGVSTTTPTSAPGRGSTTTLRGSGTSLGASPVSARADFAEPEGDCPTGNAFSAQIQLYTPEPGRLFIRRLTNEGIEETSGTLRSNGTFETRASDGSATWKGRLTSGVSSATYERKGDGCTSTYDVRFTISR